MKGTRGFEVYIESSVLIRRYEPHEAYMIIRDKEHNDIFKLKLPLYTDEAGLMLIDFITTASAEITAGLLANTIDAIQNGWLHICVMLNAQRLKGWAHTREIETFIDEDGCMIQMHMTVTKMLYERSVVIQSSSTAASSSQFAVITGTSNASAWSADVNSITTVIIAYFDSYLGTRYDDLIQRTTILLWT